jgi:hypothetical protein
MAENSDRQNSRRRPSLVSCFPLWTLVLSSSINAAESMNRQTASDPQTPGLKGIKKLFHTRTVESGFLTYTTILTLKKNNIKVGVKGKSCEK